MLAYVGADAGGYNRGAPVDPGTKGRRGGVAAHEREGEAMKIHMDVDLTPDEARTLFGLPDVKPMQKALMADMEARMKKALTAMEPDAMLKMWLPASLQSLEQWQKFIWSRMTSAAGSAMRGSDDKAT